jgi:hypothetical protein
MGVLGVFEKIILKIVFKWRGFIVWRSLEIEFFFSYSPSCAAAVWQNSELTLFMRFEVL